MQVKSTPFILCAGALMMTIACASFLMKPAEQSAASAAAAASPAPVQETASTSALFPEASIRDVTRLDISTAEADYSFTGADSGFVSLNGRKADPDVFSTLLGQILYLPVTPTDPFTPSAQPTVTLTLSLGDTQHIICFYRDDHSPGPYVTLTVGTGTASAYHKTDTWRIGTMLLTCEGTRIQDERGHETPMD